jgi:acetylornithine deacetylase
VSAIDFKGRAPENEITGLLSDLVAIESVNPALKGGQRGESAVADYVAQYLRRLGIAAEFQTVMAGRANVLGRMPGSSASGLILEAHMDTVTLEPMPEALTPVLRGGRLYGRGACDTKSSLAAMLYALKLLQEHAGGRHVSVLLAATVDEEVAYRGVLALVNSHPPATAAIVGEPTGLMPVIAHKGVVRFRIRTRGTAAHSSRPAEGNNAIYQMVEVIGSLRASLEPQLAQRAHRLTGAPTLCVSVIHGGLQVNMVPPECVIEIDRRTVPGETHAQVLAEVDAVLDAVRLRDPAYAIDREEPTIADYALETAPDSAIARAALAACRAIRGAGELGAVPYGSDASKLSELGRIPSIVLGPGDIAQAHTADEWVSIDEVARAAEIYAQIAVELTRAEVNQ